MREVDLRARAFEIFAATEENRRYIAHARAVASEAAFFTRTANGGV